MSMARAVSKHTYNVFTHFTHCNLKRYQCCAHFTVYVDLYTLPPLNNVKGTHCAHSIHVFDVTPERVCIKCAAEDHDVFAPSPMSIVHQHHVRSP